MEPIFEDVVDTFTNRRQVGVCIVASTLLHDLLRKAGHQPIIKKGFQVLLGPKLYHFHVWVEVGETKLDPADEITRQVSGLDLKVLGGSALVTDEPLEGFRRQDGGQENKDVVESERLLELYAKKPHRYWQEAPTWLQLKRRLLSKKHTLRGPV
jgi:hypothetical protein